MQNFNNKRLWQWVISILLLVNATILFSLASGELKRAQEIDWLDVVGEGGAALFVFAWFWFFLSSRPAGPVTRFLAAGLVLIFLALFQDAVDEFIQFSPGAVWNTLVQSCLLPVGMTLLTIGVYLLRKEQQVIAKQLAGREGLLRDHRLVDDITRIADVRYLHQHLSAQTPGSDRRQGLFSLVLLDVDRFNEINRRFGYGEGDRLLRALVELLLLNMRNGDLLCRYAGDRFVILLSATGEREATVIAEQLKDCVAHFNFYSSLSEKIPVKVSIGLATCRDNNIQKLLDAAKVNLLRSKEQSHQKIEAA